MNADDPGRPRPWTLAAYRHLCRAALDAGYQAQPVADFIAAPAARPLILRHDVDRFPQNALAMARAEQALGVRATYYFRTGITSFSPSVIRAIHALGHEIGYHFEVLSRAGGDRRRAEVLFRADLRRLRELAPVTTASAHGSPLSKWDNRAFWETVEPQAFGLIGDAYHAIDVSRVVYLTDTGRAWNNPMSNLRDRVAMAASPVIDDAEALMRFLGNGQASAICLQTHPERWNDSMLGTARSVTLDFAANMIKLVLRHLRRTLGRATRIEVDL